jgi:hypothetical protein
VESETRTRVSVVVVEDVVAAVATTTDPRLKVPVEAVKPEEVARVGNLSSMTMTSQPYELVRSTNEEGHSQVPASLLFRFN